MTNKQFWSIIDSTTDGVEIGQARHVRRIESTLRRLGAAELASFKNHSDRALDRAYKFRLMAAAFVVNGYISDDVFLDFCGWLILLGSRRFMAVVKSPDLLAGILPRRQRRLARPCDFLELPIKLGMTGRNSSAEFVRHCEPRETPTIKMPWQETKEAFEREYPVLFGAFWDRALIVAHLD